MLTLLSTIALAGTVFVNGVDVGDMRGQTFEDCTVVFDSSGDLHISAPGYDIQVQTAPSGSSPTPVSLAPLTPTSVPVVSNPTPPQQRLPASGQGIADGQWWLVSDDSGSQGHTVDVFVNGALARTVASGQPQVILDLGPFLVYGANRVHLQAQSSAPSGGPLYVYLGRGSNASGTVMMDSPDIQFGLGPSRNGETSRDYTLEVP
ncbi:MAG: hypothetical protein ACJATT_000247 [Myxococcota bacterium]